MTQEITVAQLKANLEAALQMRRAAETEARNVKQALVDLARRFLASELDEVKREGQQDPTQWPAGELGRWMAEKLQTKINRLEFASRGGMAEKLQEALAENERLQAEVGELRDKLAAAEVSAEEAIEAVRARDAELSGLRQEVVRLREELARAREAAAFASVTTELTTVSSGGEATKPEWFEKWQESRGFDSEQAVVRVMGFQGLCLYQSIEKALESDETIGTRTARRALERLRKRGLAEQKIPGGESRGRASHLYWLTDKGREAFQLLFGEEAIESEYQRLKARHKSDEHIALNLQARDVFVARGATVDIYPERVVIKGELYHDPDMVVVFPNEDRPLYVECERASKRGRDSKWENYAAVTSDFYFVVPNNRVQSQILSEITEWTLRVRRSVTVHICNLSALTTDEAPLWTLERCLDWGKRWEG